MLIWIKFVLYFTSLGLFLSQLCTFNPSWSSSQILPDLILNLLLSSLSSLISAEENLMAWTKLKPWASCNEMVLKLLPSSLCCCRMTLSWLPKTAKVCFADKIRQDFLFAIFSSLRVQNSFWAFSFLLNTHLLDHCSLGLLPAFFYFGWV